MSNGAQVSWWQDPRINVALVTGVPSLLLAGKAISEHGFAADAHLVVNGLLALLSLAGVIVTIIKRVKDGNDPKNPEPPIQTPAVVEAAKRLTK